jgi:hypothetical protein
MEPLELARRTYRDLSPISYLQSTHDARVHDIAFDGNTFVLVSQSWVGTDPIEPVAKQKFWVIFSRYRATFSGVAEFQIDALDPAEYPGTTLVDFMEHEIRELKIALPNVTIGTDEHELRFTCRSFDVERFAPTKEDYQ